MGLEGLEARIFCISKGQDQAITSGGNSGGGLKSTYMHIKQNFRKSIRQSGKHLLLTRHLYYLRTRNRKSLSKNNASVNSTCAQAPPGQLRGICRLVSPGGGAFANFALPGGRAFANPRAIPELLTRTRFPISEYNYKEGFNGKNADWFICQ